TQQQHHPIRGREPVPRRLGRRQAARRRRLRHTQLVIEGTPNSPSSRRPCLGRPRVLRACSRSLRPYAMPPWFDDHKGTLQLLLAVQRQDPLELGMYDSLGGGQDAEIDHSRSAALNENETPKITVASYEDSPLLMGNTKQLRILCLGQTELSGRNN